MRRDKQRTGSSDRDKVPRVLERRAVPPQDRRKHTSSSSGAGRGGKSSVISMSPEQVSKPFFKIYNDLILMIIHLKIMNIPIKFYAKMAVYRF